MNAASARAKALLDKVRGYELRSKDGYRNATCDIESIIAAAAADARRQTIEECARIASKAAADYRTLRDSPNLPDSRWRWAGAVEGVEAVEREIRALLPPASEEPQP